MNLLVAAPYLVLLNPMATLVVWVLVGDDSVAGKMNVEEWPPLLHLTLALVALVYAPCAAVNFRTDRYCGMPQYDRNW
jgi:hypothetical protein